MGLALNLRQIVGQLLQLDVVGNGPQLKHNAGTLEMRNSADTGFVITRGSDPVGNNDFVTKGAGDLAYWRSVNPNWLVTDWYIDGTVGDDTNSGTLIGAPIKTGAELLRRLGPYAMWPQSVTVHVLANGMIDALILHGMMMVAGTHLDIIGTPTQLFDCGTIATITTIDHITPAAPQLTCTGVADWTPYIGKRLQVITGASATATTWIATASPAGIGVNTARTPRWTRINTTSTTAPIQMVTPAVGSTVIVESLPLIPVIEIELEGLETKTSGIAQWPLRMVSISAIDCPLIAIRGRSPNEFSRAFLYGSQIGYVEGPPGSVTTSTGFGPFGCCYIYPASGSGNALYVMTALATACLFKAPLTVVFSGASTINYINACVFQACSYQMSDASSSLLQDVQIFDMIGATSSALVIKNRLSSFNISGSGNAGYGYVVNNNAIAQLQGSQNLQGTVTNARLSAAPAIILTIPQLIQPSDYAQKGITPAMVAGVTVVTVPWYDNATQRVTVAHAAFAGTPGILSVQQISNTQFTITSSSVLDTSTVNWAISPLGRNIFISTT
jgi:hypothetical protein